MISDREIKVLAEEIKVGASILALAVKKLSYKNAHFAYYMFNLHTLY
jgi:hypothetical protein